MFEAYLSAYPWDLLDEGVESAVDRLHGQIGLTGLALWALSPPVLQLRCQDRAGPPLACRPGGALFGPYEKRYPTERVPVIDPGVMLPGGACPFDAIAHACNEAGFGLRAVVSASSAAGFGSWAEGLTCVNAMGARSSRAVCLSHPEIEASLAAILADLSNRAAVASCALVDVVSWWSEAQLCELVAAGSLSPVDRFLLSLCFCPACMQQAASAGVDAEAVRAWVASCIKNPESLAGMDVDGLMADSAMLRAWFAWRGASLGRLVARLAADCPVDLVVEMAVSGWRRHGHASLDGGAGVTVMPLLSLPTDFDRALAVKAARRMLHVPAGLVVEPHGENLVGVLSRAADQDVVGVQIDAYGLLSDAALTTIKQAVRFARRSARG